MRNRASSGGSRDRSSRRKYSDTNRSFPARTSTDADCEAPACRDRAARYRPAGQPSVRSVSSESWVASSSTSAASNSNPASCSSSRRSGTPISCTHPSARQRPSGRAGASRLVTAISEPAGTYRTSSARTSRQAPLVTRWRSSSTSTIGCSNRAMAAPTAGTLVVQATAAGPDSTPRTSAETAPTPKSAAAMYRRNTRGSSSSRPSSDTHANARGSTSAHRARSVVLPYPAGATTVARRAPAERSRAMTSAFATVPGRTDGGASLTSTTSNGTFCYGHPRDATATVVAAATATISLEKRCISCHLYDERGRRGSHTRHTIVRAPVVPERPSNERMDRCPNRPARPRSSTCSQA